MMQPGYDLEAVRRQFPVLERCVYLSSCAIAPLPRVARQAVARATDMLGEPVGVFQEFGELFTTAHANIARLIKADPDEIALVQNTAEGINIAAHALPLAPGDNVLMCDQEYPAVVYPFMNLARLRGIEARIVPNDGGGTTIDLLERHADARTRAVALSTVEFVTGFRADLAAIGEWCRARGAWFIVDGIQSLGALDIDVKAARIDALATGGHKWLLAPMGAGFLYVDRDRLGQLSQPFAGASSVVDAENYLDYNLTFLPTARRFELGVPNTLGVAGLGASLGLLLSLGIPAIEAWTLHLAARLTEGMERLGFRRIGSRKREHLSQIVSFEAAGSLSIADASARLDAAHVIHTIRSGHLRLAAHCFNTVADVDAACAALA
jgi:selenocysteine lyase/cysteine desulfurase